MADADSPLVENQLSSLAAETSPQSDNLLKSLNDMRLEEDGTDVILQCGDTSYPAHKLILMASSSVFKTMFKSSFKEAEHDIVDMNFEPEIMERVLNFIYLRDEAPMTFEDVEEVVKTMEAAHYLHLKKLFRLCCDQFLEMSSAADFPLVCSLIKYEQSVEKFLAKHGLAIVEQDMYLGYDSHQFRIFVKEMSRVVSSAKLLSEVLKWLKHEIISREIHAEDLVSHVDFSQLTRSCIKGFIEEEIIKNNSTLLTTFLQRFVDAPETIAKPIVKQERDLIRSLVLFQYMDDENSKSWFQTSFESGSTTQCSEFMFKPDTSTFCFALQNGVYLVKGDSTTSKIIAVKYLPKLKKCEFLWPDHKPDKSYGMHVVHAGMYDKNNLVVVIEEPNQGIIYYTGAKCGQNCSHPYKYNSKLIQNRVWISCSSFLVAISRTKSNVNNVNILTYNYFWMDNAYKSKFVETIKYFVSEVEFRHGRTVPFYNFVYTFVGDMMYVYEPSSNQFSCQKSGITLDDNDVVYALKDCEESFYVVIRQDHSESEFSYKLWKVGSSNFEAEVVAKKGAVCETVAMI